MNKEFKLPDKWCVHVNEFTREYISNFVHTKLNKEEGYKDTWDISQGFYFHFPFLQKHHDLKGYCHSQQSIEEGYKEISFSQFETYFANKFNIPENYDYLIPLIQKL